MVSEASAGSRVMRWIILVVATGLAGWSAFTLYERAGLSALVNPVAPVVDERLEGFIAAGQKELEAENLEGAYEQLIKASGLNESDPRVQEGLVLVEVRRAERLWWDCSVGVHDRAALAERVQKLDAQVDRARGAIDEARRKAGDSMLAIRLSHYEQNLNTMLVVALTRSGDVDRAKGALAARLSGHPQAKLFEAFVGGAKEPVEEVADAGADAAADAAASAQPAKSASAAPAAPKAPWTGHEGRDYEFDHEPAPTKGQTVPNELELPATQ